MSTVPGNPALPAPLAPAMHPGDRDTHLDLDDLIDHSHEATQQASAGAQHPTRRWKRGVGRKSKTRKPRNPDAVMPLADHLVEFRKRFVRAIAGIIIMSIVGWMFSDQVFRILQQPFLTAAGQQQGLMSITFNGVVSAFNVKLEIAFFLGLTASCPWWSYQVWAFINPGLKRKERWTAVTFIGASVPLFLTGAGLAWYLLPQAVAILTGFAPANTATLLSADVYFDFILRMTVAFGLSFLLPVVMAALTMMNAVENTNMVEAVASRNGHSVYLRGRGHANRRPRNIMRTRFAHHRNLFRSHSRMRSIRAHPAMESHARGGRRTQTSQTFT